MRSRPQSGRADGIIGQDSEACQTAGSSVQRQFRDHRTNHRDVVDASCPPDCTYSRDRKGKVRL